MSRTKKKFRCPIKKNKEQPEFTKYIILICYICFNYPKNDSINILKKLRNFNTILPSDYSDTKIVNLYNLVKKQKKYINSV